MQLINIRDISHLTMECTWLNFCLKSDFIKCYQKGRRQLSKDKRLEKRYKAELNRLSKNETFRKFM